MGGVSNRDAFERSMKTVDCTFQNLDSSEISLTDVSHYFDSDPTKLVQGLRGDGKAPSSYIADTTTANAQACCAALRWAPLLASNLQHASFCARRQPSLAMRPAERWTCPVQRKRWEASHGC